MNSLVSKLVWAASALLSVPGAAGQINQSRKTPLSPSSENVPARPENSTPIINVVVRRVVVDVTVTDATGNPVPGLKAEDFRVSEDGAAQTLRSFEVHKVEAQPPLELPTLPPNTFTNISSAPAGGAITVVLYDLLNTPQDAQAYAHEQLLKFLKTRKTSGQVAVFVLSDKLHLLQGFTQDDNLLIAALNRQQGKGYRSGLLQTPGEATQGSDQLTQTEGNQAAAVAQQDRSFQAVADMLSHLETMESSYLLDRRVDFTAEALQQIARFLAGLPGRKNLLWLSGGFPSGVLPDGGVDGRNAATGRDVFEQTRNYSSDIREATDLLSQSHVAVYPVDVRGLQANSMFSAGSRATFEPGLKKDSQAVRNDSQTLASEHATMDAIGTETGGRAFYNTNGLAAAAAAALQEGSLYYTLTYAPTNPRYDGKLRRVRVQLAQPGYTVSYRRSYFADSPDQVAHGAHATDGTTDDEIALSLQHGAPMAHELFFEASVEPDGAPVPATPEQMADLAKYEAMTAKGKLKNRAAAAPTLMQSYVVSYGLIPRQLELSLGEDQARRGSLEFAIESYDVDGSRLNGVRTQVQDVIQPERYQIMLTSGYHMMQKIAVPVQASFLRMAVRDVKADHLGSLEIALPLKATAH